MRFATMRGGLLLVAVCLLAAGAMAAYPGSGGDYDDDIDYDPMDPLSSGGGGGGADDDDFEGRLLASPEKRNKVRKLAQCLYDAVINLADGKFRLPESCCKLRIMRGLRACEPPENPADTGYYFGDERALAPNLVQTLGQCLADFIINFSNGKLEIPGVCCKLPLIGTLGFCDRY